MTVYQITYRLNDPGQDYDSLYEAIESLGDSVHESNMCWFVDTDMATSDIRDNLGEHISSNDTLLVLRKSSTAPSWATKSVSDETTDWLHDH